MNTHSLLENIISLKDLMPRNLISMKDLSRSTIECLFNLANSLSKLDPRFTTNLFKGRVIGTMFYQPSTRTRLNFHSAIQRLGGSVIGFSDPATTRAGDYYKESLEDVAAFTAQLCDLLVLRHNETGAALRAASVSSVPLISAGDGYNEHPTQALGDIWTMHRELNGIDGHIIGMIGDLSIRSLRSIIIGLRDFKVAQFLFLLPENKTIPPDTIALLKEKNINWNIVEDVNDLLNNADLIETIGVNHPNHNLQHDTSSFNQKGSDKYILTLEKIKKCNKYIPILHPGPRTDEISTDVDQLKNAAYFRQANNGMWMRMAIITGLLCGKQELDYLYRLKDDELLV